MGIPRLFKVPKHKEFNYRPIYFDPEKEEREERIKRIKAEMGVKDESGETKYKPGIVRGQMRGNYRQYRKARRQSNVRLIVILLTLFALAYYLIYNNLLK